MKSIRPFIASILVLLVSRIEAQNKRQFYLGLNAGAHVSRLSEEYTNYNTKVSPGWGWNSSVYATMDIAPRFTLRAGLGAVLDRTYSSTVVYPAAPAFQTSPNEVTATTRYAWAQGSAGVFFKPVRKRSFALVAGGNFSVRRIIFSTVEAVIDGQANDPGYQTSDLFDWTFLLSPQVGIEFSALNNSRVMLLVEYNLGLKGLYRPREQYPDPNFDYTYVPSSYKLRSWGVSVAWMWELNASK